MSLPAPPQSVSLPPRPRSTLFSLLPPSVSAPLAVRLKALADPVRVRLMSILLAADEVCTCDLAPAVGLTEATVSHHLSVMRKAGLIGDGERL